MSSMVRSHTPEQLLVVTLNHHQLSLKDLPKFSFTEQELKEILFQLYHHEAITEVVGLCTCNRTEFFVSANSVKDGAHAIVHLIAEHAGVPLEQLKENADVLVGPSAMEHLFKLSAGLDSMVIGDAQILGQLKEAYKRSVNIGIAQKTFHSLFQKAFSIAKRVRTTTGLGKGRISISALAVEYAQSYFGSLHTSVATVIGAGKMGSLAAKYLNKAGIKELRIANRSINNSITLASEVGGKAYGLDELERLLRESDLIICTTASPEPFVTRQIVEKSIEDHSQKRLIIDIGIPPDVEPEVDELEDIILVDLEKLRGQAQQNESQRSAEIERAEEIIEEEMQQIGPWPIPLHIDTLANHLGELANTIYQEELTTLFSTIPDLTDKQRDIIQNQMKRLAERIVLAPRRNLRRNGTVKTCPDFFRCIKDLFDQECGARSFPAAETHEKHSI